MPTPYDYNRITEVESVLSAWGIKERNLRFFSNPDHTYEIRTLPDIARRRIKNTRNHNLREVMRRLPDSPLHRQCAYWVRAMVGKHFFPDANHRTAMLTLRYILQENGISPPLWPGNRSQQTVLNSKRARRDLVDATLDTIPDQDELYAVWCQHFWHLFSENERS